MPGKINPVMTEVMILACHRVAGNQAGVGFGAFSGELDLGASSAVPIRSILNSIDILSRSMVLFADKCVKGLSANAEKCLHTAETLDLAGDDGKCALRLQDRQPCGQPGVRAQSYLP